MKLATFLILMSIMQVSAGALAQKITLSERNTPLTKVFKKITAQTGYAFFVSARTLKDVKPVTIEVRNVALKDALEQIFKDQPIEFTLADKIVTVSKRLAPSFLEKVVDAFTPPEDAEGVVLDEKGNPLGGATVRVKGTKNVVITDAKGQFHLIRPDYKDRLIISYVGYQDKEVAIEENMTVRLELKSAELNEVVVAYGRQQQKSITGAVTVVTGDQIQGLPNRSFDKSLQGMVPGLVVTKGSGQPGGGVSNFMLRGIATGGDPSLGNPVRNPLIVVDGVPVTQVPSITNRAGSDQLSLVSNPLAQLNPNDIESISILKDASAIALYGSKASNGVILVTTKKGRIGKTRFTFSQQTDIANRENNEVKMLNQQQYIDLFVETYRNSYPDATREQVIDSLKQKFPTRSDGSFYPQVNWLDAISNKAAITNSTNFSISGGSEKENFYVSLERTDEKGVIRNSGYERNSFRINYEGRPSNWFKYGFNTTLSHNIQDYSDPNLIEKAQFMSPLNPIYDENGRLMYNFNYGASGIQNGLETSSPFAVVSLNTNRNTAYRALSRGYLEGKFFKYFTLSSSLGFDFMLNEEKIKSYPKVAYPDDYGYPMTDGKIERNSKRTSNIILTNTLAFNKSFDEDHSVNILLGQETQMFENTEAYAVLTGFPNNPTLEDVTGGGSTFNGGQTSGKQNSVSYFSQLNYGFKDRYFATGSIRRDGSSRFGASNKFGTFWSAGLAYVLSEEVFLKNKYSWLNYVKFRGSFGPAGNSSAIRDEYKLSWIMPAIFLGNPAVTPAPSLYPGGNAGIKWENTFTWNAGLDLRLLSNRVSFTADFYQRKTKNFIAQVPMGYAAGFNRYWANIGDMQNKGMELSLSADVLRFRSFAWNVNVNWSRNTNKLTKSFYPETNMGGTVNKVGEEYNSFYAPVWAGVNIETGRPQWIDKNQNITSEYANLDLRRIGKAQPDGTGSIINTISYKSYSLSFSIYGSYGSTIQVGNKFQNDGADPYINQNVLALNHWRTQGDSAVNPRRLFMAGYDGVPVDFGTNPSTRYFLDGDFLRLSNVRFSYSTPMSVLKHLHLEGLNLFIQGNNLALWTKYSGSDPENINAFGSSAQSLLYPQSRIYSAGINISF